MLGMFATMLNDIGNLATITNRDILNDETKMFVENEYKYEPQSRKRSIENKLKNPKTSF